MAFRFGPAGEEDLEKVFELLRERMAWLKEKGIPQWEPEEYWAAFPEEYYRRAAREGRLFVLKDPACGALAAAAVLTQQDRGWDGETQAVYVHNFAASRAYPGAGSLFLEYCEASARAQGKQSVRLDCAVGNERLNRYYEQRGYLPRGWVTAGSYHGIRREKRLLEGPAGKQNP